MTELKIWQATLASFVAITYWIVVLGLPSEGIQWPIGLRWAVGLLGVGVGIVGICVAGYAQAKKTEEDRRAEGFALGVTLTIIGVILILLAFETARQMDLSDARRFAIGVGGAALAGFVFAVARFNTMRAAASVPVVILLIGVVVWPGANELIADDIQKAIITWMGVILAANGVAEAAKQVGQANAQARADDPRAIRPTGDLSLSETRGNRPLPNDATVGASPNGPQ